MRNSKHMIVCPCICSVHTCFGFPMSHVFTQCTVQMTAKRSTFKILLHSIRSFFVCSVMSKIVRTEWFCYLLLLSLAFVVDVTGRKNGKHSRKYSMISNNQNDNDLDNDLSLWIDESQVKRFSGK